MMSTELKDALDELDEMVKGKVERLSDAVDAIEAKFEKSLMVKPGAGSIEVPEGAMLSKQHKAADAIRARYGRDEAESVRVGAIVSSIVSGKRDRLSDVDVKALGTGAGASGGFLFSPAVAAPVIDRARNAARVIQAGARTLVLDPSGGGDGFIPRLSGSVDPSWRAEGSPVTSGAPSFERVTFSAKACAAIVLMSREMAEDVSDDGMRLVENDIVQALGLKLDYAVLRGAGNSDEPLGILGSDGVHHPDDTYGAITDYSAFADARLPIELANGVPATAMYSPSVADKFRRLNTGIASDKTQLTRPDYVTDLQHLITNQLDDELVVGDFSQVIIGVRPSLGVQMVRLNEAYAASSMSIAILAYIRADVAIAHPSHLSVLDGITIS